MSFLYPLFLVGLAAVAIPIALHLFRRKTDVVVDFPAVRFLRKLPVEQQRRRRVREWVLLALRVSALALLALAFARPYFADAAAARLVPVTLVALDISLSMSSAAQFESARAAAREAVTGAPSAHAVAVLTFAETATLVLSPTTDRGAALAAIGQVQPGTEATRYRTALSAAADAIRSGQGEIVIVTDLQRAGWDAGDEGVVPDGIEVRVVEVAAPAANLAVTAVRREEQAVVAAVHNFGVAPASVPVRLLVNGEVLASRTVDAAPNAATEVRFDAALPARGGVEVRLDDPAGLAGDDARYLVLDPPAAIPILIVTAEPPVASSAGLYLERALALADEGQAFAPRVLDGRQFSSQSEALADSLGAIALLGTTTLDRAGRERIASFLTRGGRVLLALGPDIDAATLADTLGVAIGLQGDAVESPDRDVTLVAVDGRHPIFRPFVAPSGALGDVHVEKYRRLRDDTSRAVLARFSGAGDALVEQRVGEGRLLIFASDLDNRWNRFPVTPSFVPWAIETARYLVQGRQVRQAYEVGEAPTAVAAPGVHDLEGRRVAVNPTVRESNPARGTLDEFRGHIVRSAARAERVVEAVAREQEDRQRLWQIGLAVMFLALAGEGLVGRKAV